MTSKRPHSKSRLGCQQCKSRHIKCDYTTPVCLHCAKRGIYCEYQEWARVLTPGTFLGSNKTLHPESSRKALESQDASIHARCFRLEDLGHLHFFTVNTAQTLDGIGSQLYREIWQYEVPRLGLSHPPLMHALLAFAAAHHQYEQPKATQDLQAARKHFSEALVLFRASVREVTAERPDVLLCYSVLVCFLTLIFEFDRPIEEQDPIEDFVSLLGILNTSIDMLEVIREPLKATVAGQILDHVENTPPHSVAPDANASLNALASLSEAYVPSAAIMSDAILKLRQLYAVIDPRPSSWIHLLSWPIKLKQDFSRLLQERHPVALCALAHWCVPAYHAPMKWYIGDWPKRLMTAIANELQEKKWMQGIQWPITEILEVA